MTVSLTRFCLVALLAVLGFLPHLQAQAVCRLFTFYSNVQLPAIPLAYLEHFGASQYEDMLLGDLTRQHGESFQQAYESWQSSPEHKRQWLACAHYFMLQDSDQDGIADWTAIVDQKPSQVLVPYDSDIDGDGIDNILDIEPFKSDDEAKPPWEGLLPAHVKVNASRLKWEGSLFESEEKLVDLQERLYKDYGLLVLDHSDHHAAFVLESLLLIFAQALPASFLKHSNNIKYVYAFAGHDEHRLIASFHNHMQAISVGGVKTYGVPLGLISKVNLTAALAHEVGHAFLLSSFKPSEVLRLAQTLGGWPSQRAFAEEGGESFYSPLFFNRHNLYEKSLLLPARRDHLAAVEKIDWRTFNMVSHYGLSNIHEWFAEAFSAFVLRRLGEKGLLGLNWTELLEHAGAAASARWTNYMNLSERMQKQFSDKLAAWL